MTSDPQPAIRIAIVTNVVPDYRYPIFERLHERFGAGLAIFVTCPVEQSCESAQATLGLRLSRSANMSWRTRHSDAGTVQREFLPLPLALLTDLVRFKPSIVIAGDLGIRSLVCCVAAKLIGARFVLWSEDIATCADGRSRTQRLLRRWLVKRANAFLAWGRPARDYLLAIGAEVRRVFDCAQAIDNDYWIRRADGVRAAAARESLELSGNVFLLVGRLLPLKGYRGFLKAWAQLPMALHANNVAIIVGEGEQLEELRGAVLELGLTNVHLVGAKSRLELATYYAAADVFVFPSLVDVWGLVVNEALCFGLPVLGSCRAGVSQQLLSDSGVGELFDPLVPSDFASAIQLWAESPPPKDVQRCREIVGALTFDVSIAAIENMVRFVSTEKEPGSCVSLPTSS
jgi:glycosyltransferase involved in cell wall biosynthesis